jgi:hypothetical protein
VEGPGRVECGELADAFPDRAPERDARGHVVRKETQVRVEEEEAGGGAASTVAKRFARSPAPGKSRSRLSGRPPDRVRRADALLEAGEQRLLVRPLRARGPREQRHHRLPQMQRERKRPRIIRLPDRPRKRAAEGPTPLAPTARAQAQEIGLLKATIETTTEETQKLKDALVSCFPPPMVNSFPSAMANGSESGSGSCPVTKWGSPRAIPAIQGVSLLPEIRETWSQRQGRAQER